MSHSCGFDRAILFVCVVTRAVPAGRRMRRVAVCVRTPPHGHDFGRKPDCAPCSMVSVLQNGSPLTRGLPPPARAKKPPALWARETTRGVGSAGDTRASTSQPPVLRAPGLSVRTPAQDRALAREKRWNQCAGRPCGRPRWWLVLVYPHRRGSPPVRGWLARTPGAPRPTRVARMPTSGVSRPAGASRPARPPRWSHRRLWRVLRPLGQRGGP